MKISILNYFFRNINNYHYIIRRCCSNSVLHNRNEFETVFKLPSIKYIALLNRLKVYHFTGSAIAIPTCGMLEMLNVFPDYTILTVSYVGVTAAAVLSLISLPIRNVIGFLYISEDNKHIKISSVDFWGKRCDRVIKVDEWTPILDIPTKSTDVIYLSPQLTDGTKYKLLLRFGTILNAQKVGQVLE